MSRPSNNAIHGYSIDEVYKAIEEHLIQQGFDFSKKKFDPSFSKKNIADIRTGSNKLGEGRGMYTIHPNINNETGEYWSTVSYNTFASNGVNQSWAFSEYYLENKDQRLRSGKVTPQKLTPERQAQIERDTQEAVKNQIREEQIKELNATAAVVLTRFDMQRASDIHEFRNYKNHVNNYPYIKHKGFTHAYGAKFLPTTGIKISELKTFVEQNYSDKYPDAKSRQQLVTAVLDLEDKFINMSEKENAKSRRNFAQLMLPLINVKNEVTSAQYLNGYYNRNDTTPDCFGRKPLISMKALLGGGVTKASFQVINDSGEPEGDLFDKNKKIYTLSEGWATSVSLSEIAKTAYPNSCHQMQHLFGINTLNLGEVAQAILSENNSALVLIAYDNDASKLNDKLGVNAGLEVGCRLFSELGPFGTAQAQKNARCIIPPIQKNDVGYSDWNDVVVGKGMAHAVELFKTAMNDAAERRKDNVNEYEHLVRIYDDQRLDFFNNLSKAEQNEYMNPGEKSKLKGPYSIKFSEYISEKVEDKKIREEYNNNLQSTSQNPTAQNLIKAVLPKDMPLDTSLGFSYDLGRDVVGQVNTNDSAANLMAALLQSVDMNAVRNSGMNLIGGHKLVDAFVREEPKQQVQNQADHQQPEQNLPNHEADKPIVRAEDLTQKIKSKMPEISAETAAQYERQPIESASKEMSAQHSADNIDHRKSQLFTAFWLYQSEVYRAKEMIAQAEALKENTPIPERVREISSTDNEFLISNNTISRSFALIATDPEIKEKLITDLNDIVDSNPQWEHLGRLTTFISDHVIEMSDAERKNLLLQNKAVTKIISSFESNEQYSEATVSAINDALNDTSNLATSRVGRQSIYCDLVSSLYHSETEPEWVKTAIQSCNEYMNSSLRRIEKEHLASAAPPKPDSSPGLSL